MRQAYFLGANDPYKALKTTLKAEIDADAVLLLVDAAKRQPQDDEVLPRLAKLKPPVFLRSAWPGLNVVE